MRRSVLHPLAGCLFVSFWCFGDPCRPQGISGRPAGLIAWALACTMFLMTASAMGQPTLPPAGWNGSGNGSLTPPSLVPPALQRPANQSSATTPANQTQANQTPTTPAQIQPTQSGTTQSGTPQTGPIQGNQSQTGTGTSNPPVGQPLVQPVVQPQETPAGLPAQPPASTPVQDPNPTPSNVPTTGEAAAPGRPSVEELQAARDAALETLTDEEQKKRVSELYQRAIDNYGQINVLKQRGTEYTNFLGNVKERADQARSRQELSVPSLELDSSSQSLEDVQAEVSTLEQRVKALKDQIKEWTTQQTTRTERRKELQSLLVSLPTTLEELRTQQQAPAPDGESAAVSKARRAELQSQIALLENRLPTLNLEKEWLDAEVANDIVRLELDARRIELAEKEKQLAKVNELLIQKRKQAANTAAKEAVAESRSVPAQLQPLASENEELAKDLVQLTEKLTESQQKNDEIRKTLERIQEKYKETQSKVENVGLTNAIGHLLRKQRINLPTTYSIRKYQPDPDEISSAELARLQYDEMRSELVLDNADRQNFLEGSSQDGQTAEEIRLAKVESELLQKKQELLDMLHDNYDKYFNVLVDLDNNHRRLVRETNDYRSFIDERVLWIPSGKFIFQQIDVEDSDLWLVRGDVWVLSGQVLLEDLSRHWLLWVIFFIAFLILNLRTTEFRRRITALGREASSGSAMTFRPTIHVLVYTLLISLPWSVLVIFIGWRLGVQGELQLDNEVQRNQVSAIASGLTAVGFALLLLETLRHTCRELGLGAAHFGWATSTLHPIKRMIRLMNGLGLPLIFVTTTLYAVDPTFGNDFIERVCFILGSALMTYVVYRLLAPKDGILRNYYASNADGWLDRLRYVWFTIALFMPLLLAVLAITGYYYTACQLSIRLYAMFWLIMLLLVGRELAARMILVGRRRSYIEQARLRRAQAATQTGSHEESEISVATLIGSSKEWSESLSEQTKQSKNLLNSVVVMVAVFGTWLIWADVVPALRVVYQQTLWTTTETVADPLDDGSIGTKEIPRIITPTDLLQALVVLAMTFVVFRNLPGLVDMVILNRLPLDPSTRNAITAVCSYLVIVLGVVWAAKSIGVHWTQVQWLVTALTFGLAFGLQEIFANFVAGVIILFERPIRVGDVVTVDDVTGVVTRTRARATTIRNWDLKEFIVPNKEFITGRVLNWTLSDQVTRLVIPVGVAYGSDTTKASDLLLQAAQQHPLVLTDPAPLSTFEEFGDSTLNFVLRAYVAKLDDRLKVTSDLHRSIDDLFRENRIEIAFPQQDLHIRSVPDDWKPAAKPDATDEPAAYGK